MDVNLRKLIGRFPDRELELLRLFRGNPVFRSICEEIEIAETALERWKNVPERAMEYREILERLEKEFISYLSGNPRADNRIYSNAIRKFFARRISFRCDLLTRDTRLDMVGELDRTSLGDRS